MVSGESPSLSTGFHQTSMVCSLLRTQLTSILLFFLNQPRNLRNIYWKQSTYTSIFYVHSSLLCTHWSLCSFTVDRNLFTSIVKLITLRPSTSLNRDHAPAPTNTKCFKYKFRKLMRATFYVVQLLLFLQGCAALVTSRRSIRI